MMTFGALCFGFTVLDPSGLAVLAQSAPKVNPAALPQIKWKLHTAFNRQTETGAREFAARVEQLSGGRIVMEIFDSGQLVRSPEVVDAVDRGLLDAGLISGDRSSVYGRHKAFSLLATVPFAFEPRRHLAWRQLPAVKAEFRKLTDEVLKLNTINMPCGALGRPSEMWTRKPLFGSASLKGFELKGLKTTVAGLAADIVKTVGAVPITLPVSELGRAMDRTTVDAIQDISPATAERLGLGDVAKTVYDPSMMMPSQILDLFINKKQWDALPPAAREIIEFACAETALQTIARYEGLDQEALSRLTAERGVKVEKVPTHIRKELSDASQKVLADAAANDQIVRALLTTVKQMQAGAPPLSESRSVNDQSGGSTPGQSSKRLPDCSNPLKLETAEDVDYCAQNAPKYNVRQRQ